jgi:hypothetical protein
MGGSPESSRTAADHPHLFKENPMATDVQTRSLSGLTGARRGALLAYRRRLLAFLPLALACALVVQTCLLQSLLAGLADNALYGGLHALDGLPVLGIAGLLYASTRRWRS